VRLEPFVALLLCAPAAAQTYPAGFDALPPLGAERPYAPPRAVLRTLASGAALWVVPEHGLPLATVLVVMPGAGSAADPDGQGGLADYSVDLMTEGAGPLGARALADRIEGLGSTLSGWAEEDAGFVRVSMLTAHEAETLEALGWVLAAPRFEDIDARRAHEDRVTAVQLRRDEPGAVAHLILTGALQGPKAAYGHPPLGTAADLARFGAAEARAFYRDRWAPARMIVVAAGDVDPDELQRRLDGALGGWRQPGTPPGRPAVRKTPLPGRLRVVDRVGAEQANVLVGAIGLPRADARAFALEVATTILGGTFGSRLSHRLREELGYTYGVSASAGYLRATGLVAIETAIATPQTGRGLAETLRIVAELGRAPVGAAELAAAQQNLVRGLPQAFATNGQIADAFAGLAVNGLSEDWFAAYPDRVRRVTAADVRAVARAVLDPARLVTVVVGPLAAIGPDLARLGLGRPVHHDADGAIMP
jgi:zinc protease